MEVRELLERSLRLEERCAALYRSFAAAARAEPAVCALWTDLAREEEDHARALRAAAAANPSGRTRIDGWEESLAEIEERLLSAERLGPAANTDRQLAAALDVEMTEIESLRHAVLHACAAPIALGDAPHAERLAAAAESLTDDPQVRLQAALVRARVRLQSAG
ncbi:MAG TPA: ferritin family protein [Candidatus Binatia bacterium]|nr:ferritin family protein [Candidatus Binatia bacterium]